MNTIDRTELAIAGCDSVEDLFKKVAQWGVEKGIDNSSMQFAKIVEELGELAHELTRGRCGDGKTSVPSPETIDAVGDVMVTLIIWCKIVGLDPIGCLAIAYNEIKDRTGETVNGSFVKDA